MKSDSRGFTLLELLVVIGISAMIVAIVLVYSSQSRNQVGLSVESTKIGGLILQAKQLAVATYNGGSVPACGYGVYFDLTSVPQTYSLFIYSPQSAQKTGECPSLATVENSSTFSTNDIVQYSPSTWNVGLTSGVQLINDTTDCLSADVVLFYPPDPTTLMVQSTDVGQTFETTSTSYVDLETIDGKATENIAISPAGQVSY